MRSTEATGVFAQWKGQPVILQVASAGLHVSLRGVIVAEKENALRFRLDRNLEIDIYKHMILAVEEESSLDFIT